MHAFSYVYGHFRSRDKDGGHTIRSVIAVNPMRMHANFMALWFIERELLPIESLHRSNGDFWRFFAPVTLTLSDDLYIRTWPVSRGDIPDKQI